MNLSARLDAVRQLIADLQGYTQMEGGGLDALFGVRLDRAAIDLEQLGRDVVAEGVARGLWGGP